jgi:hypothetical protein
VEILAMFAKVLLQEFGREFNRDETVMFVSGARGDQRGLSLEIKGETLGHQSGGLRSVGQLGPAIEIEAKLEAAGVKSAGPVELLVDRKFVPFKAETQVPVAAKQRTPTRPDFFPGRRFGEQRTYRWRHQWDPRWFGARFQLGYFITGHRLRQKPVGYLRNAA